MTTYEENVHHTSFAGKPVVNVPYEHDEDGLSRMWTVDDDYQEPERDSAGDVAWRLASWYDGPTFDDLFANFLEKVETAEVTHLVIGNWGASYDSHYTYPLDLLTPAADRLPRLRAVFLGDILGEEMEISWIEHGDLTPLFTAFPGLEHVEVRGGQDLTLEPIRSERLRTLRFESGGLPAGVVRSVGASDLPALAHLDLWLGTANYGGDATVADLADVLSGERLPALRQLGLQDSEIQDEIAAAVSAAPIVPRLESLSLALGVLTDRGGESLLAGQPLTHLKRLDLHHHFLTDPMMERLRAALPGVELDLDEQKDAQDEDDFFIAVSE